MRKAIVWGCSFYHQLDPIGINKEFYQDIVCTCRDINKPGNHIAQQVGYLKNKELEQQGIHQPTIMKCGKIGYSLLEICDSCHAVFYSGFFHPDQSSFNFNRIHWGTGLYRRFCWHCLEAGIHGRRSGFYSKLPKVPPLPELLNPYVKPITNIDRARNVSSKIDELDSILAELEGVLSEHRQPK